MVIYADVLFVVNFFMTFLLLLITARLSKTDGKMWRLALGSAIGGVYSFIIFIDEIPIFLTYFTKLSAAVIIVLIAFSFKSIFIFIKRLFIFFFSNMLMLGVMVGLWFVFKPRGIVINNSVVYFNISAGVLLITALVSYIISEIVIRVYNRIVSKKEIYDLTVFFGDTKVHLFAFGDSGNNLHEPFSGYPVIIAKKELFESANANRIVPVETISGEGMLMAFKPDNVIIKYSGGETSINNVYVALSDRIYKAEYSAIINPKIINL